jgi:hypothetical protein
VRGVGSANDSMHKSSLGRCAPLTAQHVEAGSKRQRLPEGWKLFAPHNPPQTAQRSAAQPAETETGSLDARRLAAAASGQPPSLLACAVAWPTRGTLAPRYSTTFDSLPHLRVQAVRRASARAARDPAQR